MHAAADAPRRHLSRRVFLAGGLSAAAGLALYSNQVSRHELEITQRTFYLPRLPAAFDGYRIAQISDLHLEEYTEEYFLRHVVQQVNALAPDLVIVTGDFVSRSPLSIRVSLEAASRCAAILSGLTCPVRYGILGNHDAIVGPRIIRDHMETNGLPLLVNQHVRLEHKGAYIYLGGTDDIAWGRPSIRDCVPANKDAPVLLMVHEPDYADGFLRSGHTFGVDFIFSGHTHGGQIRLPGLGAMALPPHGRLFPEGHFQFEHFQLYVNRGIGTVGVPFRWNCAAEITLATLRPAEGREWSRPEPSVP